MTTRRSSFKAIRARKKKKKVTKKKISKTEAAKKARAKKKAANKAAYAKTPRSKNRNVKRKPTKQESRAVHPIRRKLIAPDMSMYVRDGRKMTDVQTVEAKLTMIRMLSMKGNVREATDAAGIRRNLAYDWRAKDEGFREAWDDAVNEAIDRMEAEMWRRGVEGYDHPVIYQGEITDSYTMYSDSLISLLARGNRPDKYKERTEHSTPPGQPLQLEAETKVDVISSILGMIHSKPDPD